MKNYKKITKAAARKLYNEGKEIYLHTSKLSYNNHWQNPMPCIIDKESEKSQIELHKYCLNLEKQNPHLYKPNGPLEKHVLISEFDNLINNYSYYNCDKERGLKVIYLIETK